MSFRFKLLISFFLVILLSLGVFYVWTTQRLDSFLIGHVTSDLRDKLQLIDSLIELDTPRLDEFIDELAADSSIRITVIDSSGRVVADSEFSGSALRNLENHANRPEIVQAMLEGSGTSVRFSTSTETFLLYVAERLPGEEGFLRLAEAPEDIERLTEGFRRTLGLGTLLLLLVGGVAVWWISRRMTASIETLSTAALQITSGDFVSDIPVHSSDEVGDLARQMEEMSRRLEDQLALLESERNHLSAVLNSMTEGVLVIDGHGRISSTNPAFLQMFRLDSEPLGKMPLEVVRSADIHRGVEDILGSGEQREAELHHAGRVFQVRFSSIGDRSRVAGVVAVFHDITELRRLENLRKDFISNVSHELKTPLTSIQGYSETLLQEEGLDPTFSKFVEKIYRNASQLSEIISELFSLARLEREDQRMKMDCIRFSNLMEEMLHDFSDLLSEKNLDFVWKNRTETDCFHGSERYLKRVFSNLIENAVKYTDQGSIEVLMEEEDNRFRFCVRDTGMGIPEEHLDRIFERFYRVDKDRSRSSGGTGIGLAIVKHIVQLHRGRVWAESRLDEGTSIFFTLPRQLPRERLRDKDKG